MNSKRNFTSNYYPQNLETKAESPQNNSVSFWDVQVPTMEEHLTDIGVFCEVRNTDPLHNEYEVSMNDFKEKKF